MGRGAILLAGGQSRRMGSDKWLLRVGQATVLERMIERLSLHVDKIWIILAYPTDEQREGIRLLPPSVIQQPKCEILRDENRDCGPLAGLQVGLQASPFEYNLVAATDMPFVQWNVAELLFDMCERGMAECAYPVWEGRSHPLFAVYRRSTRSSLVTYQASGGRKVMEWVKQLDCLEVTQDQLCIRDPRGLSFINMNTPQDYRFACRLERLLDCKSLDGMES